MSASGRESPQVKEAESGAGGGGGGGRGLEDIGLSLVEGMGNLKKKGLL